MSYCRKRTLTKTLDERDCASKWAVSSISNKLKQFVLLNAQLTPLFIDDDFGAVLNVSMHLPSRR